MSTRACNSCRKRKVKCDRSKPCKQCEQARLPCNYDSTGGKFRPIKPKEDQETVDCGSSSSGSFSAPSSPTVGNQELLTPDVVDKAVSTFFEEIYPTLPLISQPWIKKKVLESQTSIESYCLVGAFVAFTLIRRGIQIIRPQGSPSVRATARSTEIQRAHVYGSRVIQEVRRRRDTYDYETRLSHVSVLTSFFISSACYDLGKHTTARSSLQEAINFAKRLNIHEEESYSDPESSQDTMNRKLFWVLYVTERAQALQKYSDLVFHESIAFPTAGDGEVDESAVRSLACLVSIIRVADDSLFQLWNGSGSRSSINWTQNTHLYLSQLQLQLEDSVPEGTNFTEAQEVDVRLTQLWLRLIIWQLSIANGCLSMSATEEFMTFSYPVRLAKQAVALATRVLPDSLEVHGTGLVNKLFDIAYTLMDLLNVVPSSLEASLSDARDCLKRLMALIKTLSSGKSHYLDILKDTHAELRSTAYENAEVTENMGGRGQDNASDISLLSPGGYEMEAMDGVFYGSYRPIALS